MSPAQSKPAPKASSKPAPESKRRRWWLLVPLVALAALGVPVFFFARGVLDPPTFNVVPIQTTREYQNPALLERAWALPVAKTFKADFDFQSNGSTCGPASLANVIQSWGVPASEDTVLDGSGKCRTGICFGGLTLDEVAALAQKQTGHKITVLRGLDYPAFEKLLPTFNDLTKRYIANFQRGMLMGKGTGHFSPIGGYLEKEELVFVLDTNENFKPWLVKPRRLYDAINTEAPEGLRGMLLLE